MTKSDFESLLIRLMHSVWLNIRTAFHEFSKIHLWSMPWEHSHPIEFHLNLTRRHVQVSQQVFQRIAECVVCKLKFSAFCLTRNSSAIKIENKNKCLHAFSDAKACILTMTDSGVPCSSSSGDKLSDDCANATRDWFIHAHDSRGKFVEQSWKLQNGVQPRSNSKWSIASLLTVI